MPRTYEELMERYDLISLVYADLSTLEADMVKWLSDSVLEKGKGLSIVGHTPTFFGDWLETTTLRDVLPVWMATNEYVPGEGRIRVVKPEHPLITSLPWSNIGRHGTFCGINPAKAKEGAEVVMEIVPTFHQAYPFLVWWDVGEGRSLAIMTHFSGPSRFRSASYPEDPFLEWEYIGDFGSYYHLFTAGREIPPQVHQVHEARLALNSYRQIRGSLISMMDFISRLGVSPLPIEGVISKTDGQLAEIDRMYLDYDFEGSVDLTNQIISELKVALGDAVKLKEQTLLWIYMIEWFVLMGTSLTAGLVMWVLMVKRRSSGRGYLEQDLW